MLIKNILLGCLLVLITNAQSAFALDKESVYFFEIPGTEAETALKSVARLTEHSLLFQVSEINHVTTNSLSGYYSLSQALDALLKDTFLTAGLTNKGVIIIKRLPIKQTGSVGEDMTKSTTKSKVVHSLSTLMIAMFGATGALAEEVTSADEEQIAEENTLIITATRRATSIQKTAISIDAIYGEELEGRGIVGIGQYVDGLPGITSTSPGGNTNRIIIRNVSTSTQESGSPAVATYFDDFSVSPILNGTNDLRLVDMERVEVLKGPQGTLYGRSAMGGIIRYISNKANTEKLEGGFNTYYSNTTDGGTNVGGYGFVNVPVTDDLAVRLVGYSYQNDGFIDNVELGIKDFNDEDTNGGRVAVHWDATDAFKVDFTYLNQNLNAAPNLVTTTRDQGDLDFSFDEGPDIPYDINARTQVAGAEMQLSTDVEVLNLKLVREFKHFEATFLATQLTTETAVVFDQREFIGLRNGCLCDYLDPGTKPNTEESSIYEFRLVSTGDGFMDWIAGVYFEDSDQEYSQKIRYLGPDNAFFVPFIPFPIPISDGTVATDTDGILTAGEEAVYGELGFNFSEKTHLTVGYRYSNVDFSSVTLRGDGVFQNPPFDFVSPDLIGTVFPTKEGVSTYKFALSHQYQEDVFLYTSATSGYRRGGVNLPTVNSVFSTFDSDNLWNYEAGVKSTLMDGNLIANASVYLIDYTDIQLVVQDPSTFSRTTQNVGKAQITGIEFTLDYQFNDNFSASFSGSFSNPELKEDVLGGVSGKKGDRLPGSANENFALTANWNQPVSGNWDLFANLTTKYVGARLNDFNLDLDVELPSYSLTDIRFGISSVNGISVALFADNVFDEAVIYSIDRQGPAFESVPTNRPRTVGVNLAYNF